MNPYTNRVMIKNPEDFFNRKAEVKRIFSRIGASRPQSISIVGDRRIGKSSLLFHICDEDIRRKYLKNSEKYVFAFFDLQEKKGMTVKEFFHIVAEKITEQLPENDISIQDFSYDSFLRLIKTIEKDMNLIFVFDEFDVVTTNRNFNPEFFSFLRSVANSHNVAYITSSKRDLQELCHTREIKDSPFFNIFTHIPLGPFDKSSALELIKIPSEREGVPLEGYLDFILELAGYHPFFIQIACSNLFEAVSEHQKNVNLQKVIEKVYEEAEDHFKYMWYQLTDNEKVCLQSIVESKELDQNLSYIARKVEKRGILMRMEGSYKVFSLCFKEFIKNIPETDIEKSEENSKKKENIELTTKLREIKSELKKSSEISARRYTRALRVLLIIALAAPLIYCMITERWSTFWNISQILCVTATLFGLVLGSFHKIWRTLEKKIAHNLYNKKIKEIGLNQNMLN